MPLTALVALWGLTACGPAADAPGETPAGNSGQTPAEGAAPSSGQEMPDPLALYDAGDEEADVVATLQRLFDALGNGDAELLRSVVDPSVVMHYSEVVDGETTHGSATLDGLAERITSAEEALVERMWDPVVLMDGPLATIWTPYDFYVGETFSHCGIDVANLMRTEEGWRIVGLSWTRLQPPECERHPDGPPGG